MSFSIKATRHVFAAASLFLVLAPGASAWEGYGKDSDFSFDKSSLGKAHSGTITSDQLLEMGASTSDSLKIESDLAMRHGNIDRAIKVLAQSVELSPNDCDARSQYAEALEKKLYSQKKRDPKLYNQAVKQWLFVARKSDYDDEKTKGMTHLAKLCGRVPTPYETQKRFLSKVLVSEETTTTATTPTSKDKDSTASVAATKSDATR